MNIGILFGPRVFLALKAKIMSNISCGITGFKKNVFATFTLLRYSWNFFSDFGKFFLKYSDQH